MRSDYSLYVVALICFIIAGVFLAQPDIIGEQMNTVAIAIFAIFGALLAFGGYAFRPKVTVPAPTVPPPTPTEPSKPLAAPVEEKMEEAPAPPPPTEVTVPSVPVTAPPLEEEAPTPPTPTVEEPAKVEEAKPAEKPVRRRRRKKTT